ncbi:MAG: hypothetical protein EXS17_03030 [Phycisphaerales bacterium]|nr:hypothetical protein [Phycisphaerales bacterium]
MNAARMILSLSFAATLLAGNPLRTDAAVVVIAQSGTNFVPSVVSVSVGDSIRWNWGGGGHTVTSGDDCEPDGLFDADLSSSTPSFTWVVPASAAGTTVGYFCMPHCLSLMTGRIDVAPAPPVGDVNGDGIVNGQDLTMLLSAWGSSGGPADINADGIVSGLDLAIVLSSWTA